MFSAVTSYDKTFFLFVNHNKCPKDDVVNVTFDSDGQFQLLLPGVY